MSQNNNSSKNTVQGSQNCSFCEKGTCTYKPSTILEPTNSAYHPKCHFCTQGICTIDHCYRADTHMSIPDYRYPTNHPLFNNIIPPASIHQEIKPKEIPHFDEFKNEIHQRDMKEDVYEECVSGNADKKEEPIIFDPFLVSIPALMGSQTPGSLCDVYPNGEPNELPNFNNEIDNEKKVDPWEYSDQDKNSYVRHMQDDQQIQSLIRRCRVSCRTTYEKIFKTFEENFSGNSYDEEITEMLVERLEFILDFKEIYATSKFFPLLIRFKNRFEKSEDFMELRELELRCENNK